ncbi:LLM class flavin-dependent oxidoreductase [Vibrio sagamiensis]|uniref:Alkanesulfonate monooxygenase n=1 Tax=Vibrio sagamiensis NBRC 104589 TaxID=1219064 RepID=A0A511QG11_9VIBR|nr:LLM class flavin-dependent oxidoreductase [Vibrio sagamiensis]PNQ55063.1 LLM class flavin-dependent oxidoreductase [Vibrio agarivorans]GEM76244.1 alkanesulfonate monooxygenase [Vibrio sagamiensis NBRC 104589]
MSNVTEPARFMWNVPVGGNVKKDNSGVKSIFTFDVDELIKYAQKAEAMGIEQLLLGVGYHCADAFTYIGSLIRATKKIKFIIAYRAGMVAPTTFVQMINSLSGFGENRVSINMVAGISPVEQKYYGDFLPKEERQARLDEFMSVCNLFWDNKGPVNFTGKYYQIENGELHIGYSNEPERPEMFFSGNSDTSRELAAKHNAIWLRYSDTAENIANSAKPCIESGNQMGIRMSVIVRPTREEALQRVDEMLDGTDPKWAKFLTDFMKTCDSQAVNDICKLAEDAGNSWLNDILWTGAIQIRGGSSLAMVGDPDQVADYIMQYKAGGVSTFIMQGWPHLDEMKFFTELVIPRVREREVKLLEQKK